jgi:hypothetical protein
MAGTLVMLLQKSDLTFTAAGSSTPTEMVLARALDVTPYREGVMLIRAHASHTNASGQVLVLKAYNTAPTGDDPGYEFTNATVIATCTLTLASVSGALVNFAEISAPFGPYLKFVLMATQTTQNTAFTGTISADVVFRE